MSNGDQQLSNDFWFDFDNRFRFTPTPDVVNAYQQMGGLDFPIDLFRSTRENGTYPDKFIEGLRGQKEKGITLLTQQQDIPFDRYFSGDPGGSKMKTAFVEFGQGLLTDERRDLPKYGFNVIHSMDGSATRPPVGYHRWHGVIRAYTLLNGIADGQWLAIDRNMALAWAIQSFLKPLGNTFDGVNPNTKAIDPSKLSELESLYLGMTFDQLDDAFDHAPYPAPRTGKA